MNQGRVEPMVVVRVPKWAITENALTFYVDADPSMPTCATKPTTELTITGLDLVWAAIRSGRPPHLLQNPHSARNSAFAQWRVASCLYHLEPIKFNSSTHLRRPSIFHAEVDPTEKGHLNFALGSAMTFAYLENKLGIHWLAHYSLLDSSSQYRIRRSSPGRTEPDYIGLDLNHHYFAAEAKGRIQLDNQTKKSLQQKTQTGVVGSVNGQRTLRQFGIATITGGSTIEMFATDPEAEVTLPNPRVWINKYYEYLYALCDDNDDAFYADNEAITEGGFPPDWVPIRIYLPEPVREWSSALISKEEKEAEVDPLFHPESRNDVFKSEWTDLKENVLKHAKERAQEYAKKPSREFHFKPYILPDLTAITTADH